MTAEAHRVIYPEVVQWQLKQLMDSLLVAPWRPLTVFVSTYLETFKAVYRS